MGMRAVVTVSLRPPSSPRAARGRARPRRGPGGPPSGARGRAPDRPARERARPRTDRASPGWPGRGPPALPAGRAARARPLAEKVRRAAHAGRHHRPRRRQRLDERHRRPLVERGVHHHVEVAVDRGEVALPAEERHLAVESQLAAERLECGPLLPVAHEREADLRARGEDDPRGPQEARRVLDRHEAAHHPHEGRRLGDPRLAPQRASRQDPGEVGEIEAERHHADLVGARDAEAHEVLLHRLGHRHERVGGGGQACLQPAEERRLRGREVPAQHVAVVGVDHGGNARRARGEPAEESRPWRCACGRCGAATSA